MLAASVAAGEDAENAPLAALAIQLLQNRYRYADALAAVERLGFEPETFDPFARAYAGFEPPQLGAAPQVVEVPYDNLRIPGRLGERDIVIAIDTGAPNIGVEAELVGSDWPVDRSVSAISRVPSVGLEFPKYPTAIPELTIGGATLRNLPANFGEIPPEQAEAKARAEATLPDFDIIMGLDGLTNFFDVIEFDYDAQVLRLVRDDPQPRSAPNYILGGGEKPLIRIGRGGAATNVYVDTGAYGHLLGPDAVTPANCRGVRDYERGGYAYSEYLIDVAVLGYDALPLWVSPRSFGVDEAYGVTGVFGIPRSGVLRIDMADGAVALRDYDIERVRYDFDPLAERLGPGASGCPAPTD